MKTTKNILINFILFLGLVFTNEAFAQTTKKPIAAVLGIDSKGIIQDSEMLGYMLRLELEKAEVYTLLDKYDVADLVKSNHIDVKSCFGKTCVLNAGIILGAEQMVTGSVERFGEKIVITLKVIDVGTEEVIHQNTTEYLNMQNELQRMLTISVQKLLGLPQDENINNLLIYFDAPIASSKTLNKLSGPRMGASLVFGDAAKVMQAPESQGGYNMYPVNFQIGWQFEKQYLSAGEFQALVELIPSIGGLESGQFIPSLTLLNGFRMGKAGWEFAFGPNFRIVNKEDGFFDEFNSMGNGAGKWYRKFEWDQTGPNPNPIQSRLDSRGDPTLSTSLFIGVGRTFKSGYLNIPVNVYVIPRKEGTIAGASFGFNIYKKPKSR
ncbi:MAG: hypothetical protein H6605_10755 [Flavobacteriales bacterium]|nr:hypothetical protein [Flavobacteriales bacterium]